MKAPAGLQSDVIIELPAEDVEKASGISIDIGKDKLIYYDDLLLITFSFITTA